MFEYDTTEGTCHMYPHTSLKDKLWTDYVDAGHYNQTLYILECSTAMHNILENDRRMSVDTTCSPVTRLQYEDSMNDFNVVYSGDKELTQ